jgi:hypothetical protein
MMETPMALAQTAAEYHSRYVEAFKTGGLTQGAFHSERDGRQVACALGVIGDTVEGASQCPAQIMPRWLAQMVPAFFDRQKQEDAFQWGVEFTDQLKRIDGKVPFSVVHDWHANTVCQLGIDAAEKRGRDPAPHKALQALHLRALAGENIAADEWRPVLKSANANAYAYAYADADAYADAYAYANADANADAYAYANADADAYAYANAYAVADAVAVAYAYAVAVAYAYAYAYADAYAYAYAWKLLADGMVAALSRVPA